MYNSFNNGISRMTGSSTNNNIVANNNDHIYLQIKLFQFQLHISVKKLLFKFLSIFFDTEKFLNWKQNMNIDILKFKYYIYIYT